VYERIIKDGKEKTQVKKLITICAVTILLALLAGQVQASLMPGSPLSGEDFTINPGEDFTVDLFEPEPDTNPLNMEFSTTGPLPGLVVPGFVVLTEFPALDPQYPNSSANWSDIVEFRTINDASGNPVSSYADFYSDIEGQPFDPNLVDRVLHEQEYRFWRGGTEYIISSNTAYRVEDSYPTVYSAGVDPYINTYNIYSIPEPATIALLGLGALSLIRRKR
jgi:hypothetical protein